jgi:hypothetical protein
MRIISAIPTRTSVWLAVSADPSFLLSTKNRHKRAADDEEVIGVSTTMVFGHAAIQVFTIRVPEYVTDTTEITANVRAAPWHDLTMRVWPPRSTFPWPPSVGLNGESGINLFADRFETSGFDRRELDTLVL